MVEVKDTSRKKAPELVAFGAAVRRQRMARGYSQEAFGDTCGIDRSYKGEIERGEHNLALVNILKIIKALGMQPSEFFKDLDEPGSDGKDGPTRHKEVLKELANLLMEEAYQQLMTKGEASLGIPEK